MSITEDQTGVIEFLGAPAACQGCDQANKSAHRCGSGHANHPLEPGKRNTKRARVSVHSISHGARRAHQVASIATVSGQRAVR